MLMSNNEIYNYATQLFEAFKDTNQKLPIKINFYLQKNKKVLSDLSREIELARMNIIQAHGVIDEDGNYTIADNKELIAAQKELDELLLLEQEIQIYKVNINDFSNDILLTTGQMEALMFMIE